MKSDARTASLLPYLNARQGIRLSLSLQPKDSADIEKPSYPFLVLEHTDPLARLVEGQFVTDADAVVRPLFLLVERDAYTLREDPLRPTTNADVERAWQDAYEFYRSSLQDAGFLSLAVQLSDQGRLERLAALLFCRARRAYFHPPCPRCGQSLELCTDDAHLIDSGLAPYSGSVKRYLFCADPGCSGASDLYAYDRAPFEPSVVRDRWDLIRELGLLADDVARDDSFPCRLCHDRQACFESYERVLSRIVPFSFYPFYVLFFEAMSVSALDFAMLLSGAPGPEAAARLRTRGESGRAERVETLWGGEGGRFLFQGDPRMFLEVLYLKLTLLAAIIRDFPGEDRFAHRDFALSLDRVWAKTEGRTSLLPSYWTFTTCPIDIYWGSSSGPPHGKGRPDLHSLALAWFCILVANEEKTAAAVSRAVQEWSNEACSSGDGSSDGSLSHGLSVRTFPPGDVFWSSSLGKAAGCDETEVTLWERSLALGWSLIEVGERGGEWSREGFLGDLEVVRESVRKAMFGKLSSRASHDTPALDDSAVRGILEGIIRRWRSRFDTGSGRAAEPEEEEEELVQTVIVSSKTVGRTTLTGFPRGKAPAGPVSPGPGEPSNEALEETVLLPAGIPGSRRTGLREADVEGLGEKGSSGEEGLEETVIVSLKGAAKVSSPSSEKGWSDDDLEKTIIMAGGGPKVEPDEERLREKAVKKGPKGDEMAETVILSPKAKKEAGENER